MNKDKKNLYQNTILLYIMRFSMFFFAFLVMPYLTRVLGVENFAKLGVANALMIYFFYIIDFGFILSGTQDIALVSDDKRKVSRIYTSIQIIKIFLIIISAIILFILFAVAESYREDWLFYFLFLLSTGMSGMIPSHVFRGLQQMKAVTYTVIISQIIYTVSTFLIVKGPEQLLWIPVLKLAGDFVSLIISVYILRTRFNVKFVRINKEDIINNTKASSTFFLSRIAGTVYGGFNVLILDQLSKFQAGLYTVSNKLISTGQTAISPISDSIFPYMTKNKDFKLIKKLLLILMPIVLIGSVIVYFYASEIISIIFGKDYYESGEILRAMIPVIILTIPQYLLGYPTLSALGIVNIANYSVYISSVIHIIILAIMWKMNMVTAVNLARLVSFTTAVDLSYRIYHIYKRNLELKAERE